MSRFSALVVLSFFALLSACSLFGDPATTPTTALPAAPAGEATLLGSPAVRPAAYPLTTCIVSGKPLGDTAVTFEAAGRTWRTCCTKCQAKIESDPQPWLAQLDAAAMAAQRAVYPLTTCPISGKPLGEMGEPVELLLDGVLVRLCCEHCVAKAKADAATIVDTVRAAAIDAQAATYPLTTCLVSGRTLGEHAVSRLFGTTLARFCCDGCAAKCEAAPSTWLGKLATAKTTTFTAIATTRPLSTCFVSGKPLGAKAVTFEAGGETFTTCCGECRTKVEADPKTFALRRDQAICAQQRPDYPLTTCPISGKPLGEMGEPVELVLDGTLVRLCCSSCVDEAKAKAGEVAAAVRTAAVAQQRLSYPLTTCPVSGRVLGDDALSTVVGTTLVRLCCEQCATKVAADPTHAVDQVQTARAAALTDKGSCCSDAPGTCCCQPPAPAGTTTGTPPTTDGR